ERSIGFHRLAYGRGGILAATHPSGRNPIRVGELDEVRTRDWRGRVPTIVEELLPLANHAEESVVDDRDLDAEVALDNRAQLLHRDLESAVSDDDPDRL